MEKLRDNNIFKNNDRKNNYEAENVGRKNSVNWNHIDSILNQNQRKYDSIRVDPNHTNLDQLNTTNLTNIGSIHDLDNIRAIEKKFT